jgi:hypothetical protein
MNFNAETYIALASAIVSLCALGAAIWQGKQNYKHNKLSVRPFFGTLQYNDVVKGNVGKVTFTLINCGIGPAIIKSFVLLFDGKEVSRNNIKTFDSFLRGKFKDFSNIITVSYVPGAAIEIGERTEIFSFEYMLRGQDISIANKLNLIVDYQSIYQDEVFTYDSRLDRRFHGEEAVA